MGIDLRSAIPAASRGLGDGGLSRRASLVAIAGAVLSRRAAALPAPSERVVLHVTGQVEGGQSPGQAQFDMPMLAALPQRSFQTRTPWYKEPRKFTGPLMRDVLAAAGAKGTTLRAVALNEYRVDIPLEDAMRFDMIIARLLDDEPMLVRDKGPLFIVYPFDSVEGLNTSIYHGRSAWQLKAIEVS